MNNHILETKNGSDITYFMSSDIKKTLDDFTQFLGKKRVAGNYGNRFFYSAFDIFDKKGTNKIYVSDYPYIDLELMMPRINHDPSIILHFHGKQPTSMNNYYTFYCGNLHIRVYGTNTENISSLPFEDTRDDPSEILKRIIHVLSIDDFSANDILVYNKELLKNRFLPEWYFKMFLDFFPSVIKKLY